MPETLGAAYRRLAGQLARAWALCSSSGQLEDLHGVVRFYEEVRVWMAKLDAAERQARGEPIPSDIERLLGALIADSTETGEVLDIYEAAGMPKPSLMDLGPDFVTKAQAAENPHLAIEALRDLIDERVGQGDGDEHPSAAGLLRADRRADAQVHQPAAHLGRGHRGAHRDGAGGRCRDAER